MARRVASKFSGLANVNTVLRFRKVDADEKQRLRRAAWQYALSRGWQLVSVTDAEDSLLICRVESAHKLPTADEIERQRSDRLARIAARRQAKVDRGNNRRRRANPEPDIGP